jgi:hypothetical protein
VAQLETHQVLNHAGGDSLLISLTQRKSVNTSVSTSGRVKCATSGLIQTFLHDVIL